MFKFPGIDVFPLLLRHQVPFVIVGGYAVNIYAPSRATEDIDLVWLRSDAATDRLTLALQQANAHWISDERDPQTNLERLVPVSRTYVSCEHLMMLETNYGFIDLFDFVPGLPGENVEQFYADSILVGDRRYASLDWLKRMKQAAGRPKDLEDLRNLP